MVPKHSQGSSEVTTGIWDRGCERRYVGVQTEAGSQMCPSPGSLAMTTDMTANMTTDRSSDTGAETGGGTVSTNTRPRSGPQNSHRLRDQEMRPEHACSQESTGRPRMSMWKPGDSTPVCSGSRTPRTGMFGQAQVQRCPSPGMSPDVHNYTPQPGLGLARTPDSHLRQGLQAPPHGRLHPA